MSAASLGPVNSLSADLTVGHAPDALATDLRVRFQEADPSLDTRAQGAASRAIGDALRVSLSRPGATSSAASDATYLPCYTVTWTDPSDHVHLIRLSVKDKDASGEVFQISYRSEDWERVGQEMITLWNATAPGGFSTSDYNTTTGVWRHRTSVKDKTVHTQNIHEPSSPHHAHYVRLQSLMPGVEGMRTIYTRTDLPRDVAPAQPAAAPGQHHPAPAARPFPDPMDEVVEAERPWWKELPLVSRLFGSPAS